MNEKIEKALADLKAGKPVLVYDSDNRERETDFVFASEFVTPDSIEEMRRYGGGLICTTVPYDMAEKLGLPYMADLYQRLSGEMPVLGYLTPNDIPYDEISSFSLTINARDTFTGITDRDRALTVSKFARLLADTPSMDKEEARRRLGSEFRAPGHIHLLRSSNGVLNSRQGHTELSTALVMMAGLTPSATICEMMGHGYALPKEDAMAYASEKGYIWLTGKEVMEAWKEWSE